MSVATVSAEQLVNVSEGGVVQGHVSSTGVTRISFVGDEAASIQMAKGGEGPGFSIAHEPTTGDLYLTLSRAPYRGEGVGAASFFVTTRSGYTYQMELAAREVPSTQLRIRNEELVLQTAQTADVKKPLENRVVSLTRAMWNSALADGYKIKRPHRRERAAGSLRLMPLSVYEGSDLNGRIINVRNTSTGVISLSEQMFMAPGVVSVVIKGARELGSNESATIMIVDRSAS